MGRYVLMIMVFVLTFLLATGLFHLLKWLGYALL